MRSGPRANASDSEIASLIAQGMNNSEIARACHVDRRRIAKLREMVNPCSNALDMPIPIDTVRAVVRLELTQEKTLNEFSDQLAEYTKNYKLAMEQKDEDGVNVPDLDGAGKWAFLRLRLLEHMIKISGLSARRPEEPPPTTQDALNVMTDQEVEARARAILAKRQ